MAAQPRDQRRVGDGTGIARSIDTRTRGHMSRDPP